MMIVETRNKAGKVVTRSEMLVGDKLQRAIAEAHATAHLHNKSLLGGDVEEWTVHVSAAGTGMTGQQIADTLAEHYGVR